MLSEKRKLDIAELAEFIADEYCPEGVIIPEKIAQAKGLKYSYGNYKNGFDGMLEWKDNSFHIFINLDRLGHSYKPRARFTFAHELGHYFIDEHRNALQSGEAPAHSSFTNFASENEVEREADYFAACLLLPKARFKADCFGRKFNFNLVDELATKYQTSITSTLLRFVVLDIRPLLVVCSQNGMVKWKWRTQDFPYYNLKDGKKLSEDTSAAEYFLNKKKYRHTEEVCADDWFHVYDEQYLRRFYEHCIYFESMNSVISVVWEN